MKKQKLKCKLGFHTFEETNKILLERIGLSYYNIVKKCKYCGKYVIKGTLEAPLPTYMINMNFEIINDKEKNNGKR